MQWLLKYHERRELWILEAPFGNRYGFQTEVEAVRFAKNRDLDFRKVEPDNSPRCVSDKTARRQARRGPVQPEEIPPQVTQDGG